VRLATLLALSEMPPTDEATRAVIGVLASGDRWLLDGATAAAAKNAVGFLRAISERVAGEPSRALAVIRTVAEHYARGAPADSVGSVLAALGQAEPEVAAAIVHGVIQGWPKDRPATLGPAEGQALAALVPKLPPRVRGPLIALAGRWGVAGLEGAVSRMADDLLAEAGNPARPDNSRGDAAVQLVELRPTDAKVVRSLVDLITPRTSPALASGLIAALSRSTAAGAGALVIERLPALTPALRADAIRAVVGREDWTSAFLDAVETGKARLDDLALDQKQALAAHPNSKIAARVKPLLERGGGLPDPDRQKVIERLA
jgi:hypothetical protein